MVGDAKCGDAGREGLNLPRELVPHPFEDSRCLCGRHPCGKDDCVRPGVRGFPFLASRGPDQAEPFGDRDLEADQFGPEGIVGGGDPLPLGFGPVEGGGRYEVAEGGVIHRAVGLHPGRPVERTQASGEIVGLTELGCGVRSRKEDEFLRWTCKEEQGRRRS